MHYGTPIDFSVISWTYTVQHTVPKILNKYSQKLNCAASLPISTVTYLEVIYIPKTGFVWKIYFPVLHHRTLSSTKRGKRRAENCRQAVVGGSSLPSPTLLWLSREFTYCKWPTYKFPSWKITDHKWKQLILVVNILFGLGVIVSSPPFAVHFFPNHIPYKSTHPSFAHVSGYPSRPSSTTSHISF